MAYARAMQITFQMLVMGLAGLFGLAVGSFLNLVISRLPVMLEQSFRREIIKEFRQDFQIESGNQQEIAQDSSPDNGQGLAPKFNLMQPASHCLSCGHVLPWYENIPLLSYIRLAGRCSVCRQTFGIRHLLVESIAAAWAAWLAYRFGLGIIACCWYAWGCALLVLAFIDAETKYLPDDLTIPLIWAGLLASGLGYTQLGLWDSVLGAVSGYLLFWSVYWLFRWVTKKEGLGRGDFKLLAALGAWLGWMSLPWLILGSSVMALVVEIGRRRGQPVFNSYLFAFGPYLCVAGLGWWMISFA